MTNFNVTKESILYRHLRDGGPAGSPMAELQQVLPTRSRAQVKRLLDELAGKAG